MTRSPLTPVTVKVRYTSVQAFLAGERGRVSALGILLRAKGQVAIGERVLIRVELEGGQRVIVAEGVARVAPPQLDGEEGQWIQFRRFDSATKAMMKNAIADGTLLKHPTRARRPSTRIPGPISSVMPDVHRFSAVPVAFNAPSVAPTASAGPVAATHASSNSSPTIDDAPSIEITANVNGASPRFDAVATRIDDRPVVEVTTSTDDTPSRHSDRQSGEVELKVSAPRDANVETEDSGVRNRPSPTGFVPPTAEKRESLLAKLRRRVASSSDDSQVTHAKPSDKTPLARQA